MRYRDKPGPARDWNECGDPWQVGNISDKPSADDVRQVVSEYDAAVDDQLGNAGVHPSHPEYDMLRRTIADNDMLGSKDGFPEHGDPLPMKRRTWLENAPASAMDEARERKAWADGMLREYQERFPDQAGDLDGVRVAITYTMRELQWHGENPARWARANPEAFLKDVALNHSAGLGRHEAYAAGGDNGRTSGIDSGGRQPVPTGTFDGDGMIGEMRALQKARGWTP